jgi:VanZ family protein
LVSPWLPVLTWAATIFVLSSLPGSAYPAVRFVGADKVVHVCLYALLGALCARALLLRTRLTRGQVAAVAAALASVYGLTDELHQLFVRGRSADFRDALADALGGLLGVALALWLHRKLARTPRR